MSKKSTWVPIALIVVGAVFLLSNLGLLPPVGPLFKQWWPLIPMGVGVLWLLRRR